MNCLLLVREKKMQQATRYMAISEIIIIIIILHMLIFYKNYRMKADKAVKY